MMKQSMIVLAAFLGGCIFASALNPLRLAYAQDRPQIKVAPKSLYENVLAGQNIWMFDSPNNQVIGCHFAGAASSQLVCEKAKLP